MARYEFDSDAMAKAKLADPQLAASKFGYHYYTLLAKHPDQLSKLYAINAIHISCDEEKDSSQNTIEGVEAIANSFEGHGLIRGKVFFQLSHLAGVWASETTLLITSTGTMGVLLGDDEDEDEIVDNADDHLKYRRFCQSFVLQFINGSLSIVRDVFVLLKMKFDDVETGQESKSSAVETPAAAEPVAPVAAPVETKEPEKPIVAKEEVKKEPEVSKEEVAEATIAESKKEEPKKEEKNVSSPAPKKKNENNNKKKQQQNKGKENEKKEKEPEKEPEKPPEPPKPHVPLSYAATAAAGVPASGPAPAAGYSAAAAPSRTPAAASSAHQKPGSPQNNQQSHQGKANGVRANNNNSNNNNNNRNNNNNNKRNNDDHNNNNNNYTKKYGPSVRVVNPPANATEDDLAKLFNSRLPKDGKHNIKNVKTTKTCAYVDFEDNDAVLWCVKNGPWELNGTQLRLEERLSDDQNKNNNNNRNRQNSNRRRSQGGTNRGRGRGQGVQGGKQYPSDSSGSNI